MTLEREKGKNGELAPPPPWPSSQPHATTASGAVVAPSTQPEHCHHLCHRVSYPSSPCSHLYNPNVSGLGLFRRRLFHIRRVRRILVLFFEAWPRKGLILNVIGSEIAVFLLASNDVHGGSATLDLQAARCFDLSY